MVSSDVFAVAMCHRWYISSRKHSLELFFSIVVVAMVVVVLLVLLSLLYLLFCSLLFFEKIYLFLFMFSQSCFSLVFEKKRQRMIGRECVRARFLRTSLVDLFNEFALFFETFHFNLFSTLLNCITFFLLRLK